jgi:hypothetical protein
MHNILTSTSVAIETLYNDLSPWVQLSLTNYYAFI